MVSHPCPRRRFLEVIAQGGAALGAAGLGVGAAGCSGAPAGPIPAGNVSSMAEGTLQAVSGESVAIGRDTGGLYAMSLICTHQGCDMESQGSVSAQGVTCFCHGSRFDANGNVLAGPASSPLQHYAVTVDATGAITIDAGSDVTETARTAISSTTG